MSIYLDASLLVSLFSNDALTDRADAWLRSRPSSLVVSDFVAAEFASAIARRVRMKILDADEARIVFSIFDTWTANKAERIQLTSADIVCAAGFLRRLEVNIRTPDAINIAIVQRIGAELLTFDNLIAANARILGTSVVEP